MLKSFKIPLAFLATGICWALLSDPTIRLLVGVFKLADYNVYHGLNDFIFVFIIALVLYFEINKQQRRLAKSEADYRHLFESNPNPMWIYRESDLRFLKVNEAAIEKYEYNRLKFLRMTVYEVNVNGDTVGNLRTNSEGTYNGHLSKHRKGTGQVFPVTVNSYPIIFDNRPCKLVLITDMSEVFDKEQKLRSSYKKIKKINQTLMQVAWSNSHELRKPICSILGLVTLLKISNDHDDLGYLTEMLDQCSAELDAITRDNNRKVSEIASLDDKHLV